MLKEDCSDFLECSEEISDKRMISRV